ncbi:MAG: hypothetical protein RI897_4117 [Verrucomicrobiota bacterium]
MVFGRDLGLCQGSGVRGQGLEDSGEGAVGGA